MIDLRRHNASGPVKSAVRGVDTTGMQVTGGVGPKTSMGPEELRPVFDAERVFTGLLVLAALFFVLRELAPVALYRPADGVVMSSGVSKFRVYGRRTADHYAPRIYYRYEVEGDRYVGFQYKRTTLLGLPTTALRESRSHRVGSTVRVWYDPRNPSEAVLSRQPDWILLGGIVFFNLYWWRLGVVYRQKRERLTAARLPARRAA